MEITGSFGDIPVVDKKTTTNAGGGIGADKLQLDFLKLLVAQLQFQDPLEPATNTEFTSQMAQFSSLDAQQQSNKLLQQLLDSQGTSKMNQAVAYIGKQVVVAGNKTTMKDGTATVRFRMPEAGAANFQLYNSYGELVKDVGQFFPSGEGSMIIDGTAIDGSAFPDGAYTFSVHMTGSDGERFAVSTLEAGQVTGVIDDDSGVMLDLGGRLVAMDSVRRVEQNGN